MSLNASILILSDKLLTYAPPSGPNLSVGGAPAGAVTGVGPSLVKADSDDEEASLKDISRQMKKMNLSMDSKNSKLFKARIQISKGMFPSSLSS